MVKSMNVRINITLSEDLERRFREEVFKRYGMKKGNIAKAVEEAIKKWIEEGESDKKKEG